MLEKILIFIKENLFDYYEIFKNLIVKNYERIVEIIIFLLFLIAVYFLIKFLISKIIKLAIKIRIGNHDEAHKERIETLFSVLRSILKIIFFFILILFILKTFEIKLIPIITGAGVLGAAFVFSFQSMIQDIIRGWILIFEDQARKGEWVNINNTFTGKVIEFNLRYMVLQDRERNYIFLPNSQINFITNLSRSDKKFFIGIRFNKDIDLNKKLEEIAKFIENNKA
ncbi:MAG: mechanosensitive ion channel, partial [Patescibacteria group bacterium]|nr:mechanosensitive ion channel [Patescibacteria group bacterium]